MLSSALQNEVVDTLVKLLLICRKKCTKHKRDVTVLDYSVKQYISMFIGLKFVIEMVSNYLLYFPRCFVIFELLLFLVNDTEH